MEDGEIEESETKNGTKNESRNCQVTVRWENESFQRLDDVTAKKCKSFPSAYSPSATARRAEEMLSSLGESIELTSSNKKAETQEKIQAQKDILKVGERRKRKYDVAEVSNVLAEVSLELNDILGQGKPGYPLNSMFGMTDSLLPAKIIRLQFDANDEQTNVDKSSQNVELTSQTLSHPLLFCPDIDKITRVAASQVNDSQQSKQQTESDEKKSSNANGQTVKQTEHVHNPCSSVIQAERKNEIEEDKSPNANRQTDKQTENRHSSCSSEIETEQKTEIEEERLQSSDSNRHTDKQTEHLHIVIQTERETVIEQRNIESSTDKREREREESSNEMKESVGGPTSLLQVSSDFVRREREKRCNRRHCRHRCSKRHKRKKRKQFEAEETSNRGRNQVNYKTFLFCFRTVRKTFILYLIFNSLK